jgi:cation transporter-like permease
MSFIISLFSLVFGYFFWGITIFDYFSILIVLVSTVTIGLLITLLTVKVTFISFKRGLDPDTTVYPLMSTLASILITLCYLIVLNLYQFGGVAGVWITTAVTLFHIILVLSILPRNLHEPEFTKTIKESIGTVLFVAFTANLTGTALKGINNFAQGVNQKFTMQVLTAYPALINIITDVGLLVGSSVTSKISLGYIKPSYMSIGKYLTVIFIALLSSMLLFLPIGVLSLVINGDFILQNYARFLLIMVLSNVISVFLMVIVSHGLSIIRFKRGLDQDTFATPYSTALAYLITTVALLIAMVLIK